MQGQGKGSEIVPKWAGGVAQAEECLLCKPEAQSSNPSPTKKEGGRERERERRRGRERERKKYLQRNRLIILTYQNS
jgi:hypothetical protein